ERHIGIRARPGRCVGRRRRCRAGGALAGTATSGKCEQSRSHDCGEPHLAAAASASSTRSPSQNAGGLRRWLFGLFLPTVPCSHVLSPVGHRRLPYWSRSYSRRPSRFSSTFKNTSRRSEEHTSEL